MNKITRTSIAKIMFCYALLYEHYKHEELRERILQQIERVINEYIPTERFTLDEKEVIVIRESNKKVIYQMREKIEGKLPKFNELLLKYQLHSSRETLLSFLFYLIEEYQEKTNNPGRYKAWKELEETIEEDDAYSGVAESPEYMGTVEKCYLEMIEEVVSVV